MINLLNLRCAIATNDTQQSWIEFFDKIAFMNINVMCQLVAERFNIPVPLPPLEIGKEILNEKSLSVSLIIGVAWSNEDKDWRYLVVDEGFNTPPLWVSAAQIQGEMFV
ncbi:hypothetical protein WDZ92_41005 [Nostoc sp. NIES-2111]